jgi:hypothetical protein
MKTTAFLGIDVSKGYADFLLLAADKTVLEENFRICYPNGLNPALPRYSAE